MGAINLLPRNCLITTGPVDHADWNYRLFLGVLQRSRFRLAKRLLRDSVYRRVLEVGYGSGVFMPELAGRCSELYGIDQHHLASTIAEQLQRVGVNAELATGSITALPYEDGFFDAIVAISCLEYVDDIESACTEMVRVLNGNGSLIVVTPGHSSAVDWGLKLFTGEEAQDNYGDRRTHLRQSLLRFFGLKQEITFPAVVGRIINVYSAYYLCPKK